MFHRIRAGLVRTLVHQVLLPLAYALRVLSTTVPVRPTATGVHPPPQLPYSLTLLHPRTRPHLLTEERRTRRTVMRLALDGFTVGPRAGQPHCPRVPMTGAVA